MIALARARDEDAGALSATEALELATLGGARALGLDAGDRLARPGKARGCRHRLPFRLSVSTMGGSGGSRRLRRRSGARPGYPRRRRGTI